MESLLSLKQELITQKEVIEGMSGYVTCAYDHPSPAEITAGIKTIPSTDLSEANATEDDVAMGKTFYAGNSELKTGTGTFDSTTINALFMYNLNETYTSDVLYYTMPDGVRTIKRYLFSENDHNIRLTLSPNITLIEDYSFYEARSIVVENFNELTNLIKVANYAFFNARSIGIDIGNLPNSIKTLNTNAFANTTNECYDYKLPDSLSSMGQGVFKQDWRIVSGTLDLSNFQLTTLPSYTFYYHAFNCDFVPPTGVTTVGAYFNHGGSFKNVVLHSGITAVQNYAFGAYDSNEDSNFYMQTFTFEGETPPTIGTNIIASHHIRNGVKIYVPDNVIEEYKAVTNLAQYADSIYPVSEKE